jgi:hypothetical protein
LVAGCGTVARLDFKGHSRPATPADVSVYLGGRQPQIDPRRVSAGPVEFNITNQTGRSQAVAVVLPDGRVVERSPAIAAGETGQLRADLTLTAYGIEYAGRTSSMRLLQIKGRPRDGNNDLLQS